MIFCLLLFAYDDEEEGLGLKWYLCEKEGQYKGLVG